MLNLHIDAADTLFFRDGRPFTMGEDTHVESVNFPPMPSVVYGALRTAFISQNTHLFSLEKLIELSDKLEIKSIALRTSNNNTFLPMPKDLVVPKNKKEAQLLTLSPEANPRIVSSLVTSQFLQYTGGKVEEEDFILIDSALQDYLDDPDEVIRVRPQPDRRHHS